MPNELSLVSVVIFIASGFLVLVLLFLFAKRQITRFTLKSSRQAHEPIGGGAPKEMCREILRRLEYTHEIKSEPPLIHDRCEAKPHSLKDSGVTCNYKYRMLAVDAFSSIDVTLEKLSPGHRPRHPNVSVRKYLLTLHHKGPLLGAPLQLIHAYANAYEHARHYPQEFGQEQYKEYIELLQKIISCLQAGSSLTEPIGPEKVETEVIFQEGQSGEPIETKTVPVASEAVVTKPGVLQGMQTRLRGTGRQPRLGDQQALLDSMSSARSSEDRSDPEDLTDRLISPSADISC
ncbi:protein C1orf43 homolog [Liolophura sinensis]|uniref:protein C1orf43 homolog n=1 Tax=Liolophura sinensis TaxID=3198878 RepID=UPI0031582FF4